MFRVTGLSQEGPRLLMAQSDKGTTAAVKSAYDLKQQADAVTAPVETLIMKDSRYTRRKADAEADPYREGASNACCNV